MNGIKPRNLRFKQGRKPVKATATQSQNGLRLSSPPKLNDQIKAIRFDPLIDEIFRELGQMLHKIYRMVFQNEIKGVRSPRDDDWEKSKSNLFEFLKKYEVCPNLVGKSIAIQIF